MSTISVWKQPRFVIAVLVYAGTLTITGGVGSITWNTPFDLSKGGLGTYDTHNFKPSNDLVEISPSDQFWKNYVADKGDFTFTISEKAPLGLGNIKQICMGSAYIKVVVKYGYGTTVYCDAAFGIIQDLDTSIRLGPNTDTTNFRPVGNSGFAGLFSDLPAIFA